MAYERQMFPDPRLAGEEGILCVGGGLDLQTLIEAYSIGVFPWPQQGLPLLWFSPAERGVIDFDEIHWPKRFLQELRSKPMEITFNQEFAKVIHECAKIPRAHESGTWILPAMERAYVRFHEAGFAHSVECWEDGRLVGGLYGVYVRGVFSGESMFHKVTGASKRCLHALVHRLAAQGVKWMDIQMVTPVSKSFGGKYVLREEFLERLEEADRAHPAKLEL